MKKLLRIAAVLLFVTGTAHSQTLIHYWNFNDNASQTSLLTPDVALVPGSSITHVAGGSSEIDVAGGTGQNFDAENLNARNGDAAGTHLRFNNPIGGMLVFSLPSTSTTDVIVKYVTRRSGSGAGTQKVEYALNGTDYQLLRTISITETPTLQTLDFSAIDAVDNNPDFKIRISFEETGGGAVGNNRFDNFTMEGTTSIEDIIPPTVSFAPADAETNVATSIQPAISFNEDVRLINNAALNNTNVDALVELRLDSANGTAVAFDATVSGRIITITPSAPLMNNRHYYVALKANAIEDMSDNAITSVQSTLFITIAAQTAFTAGDIVPVAYRMNATGTEDEIALLTFVNILPGTIIQLTDSKYTDNAQPQCADGIVWTAPAQGVPAGVVIRIQTSALVANLGTVSGSDFGLSSGGDQVIIYTGSAASPSYITAFSSNVWLAANTECGGSNSKLPAGLVDGTSSINLSTASGNVSGNSANAYYNGIQTGTVAELKAAILNPANWVTAPSGSAPQTWPQYAFPGPPRVVEAAVISQTKVQLAFNGNLDAASSTNLANFTGIAGLAAVTLSDNSALPDTLVLTFNTPFVQGTTYTLMVNDVKDSEGRAMFNQYVFIFSYNTTISFKDRFISVKEPDGNAAITLLLENPAAGSVKLALKPAPFSNTSESDISFADTVLTLTGSSGTTHTINIPVLNDALSEMDEYFVLSLEDLSGVALKGKQYLTVYVKDDDRKAPAATGELSLKHIGSFKPNDTEGSTTEIVAYDVDTKRLFMTSAIQDRLDITSFANLANITLIKSIDMSAYGGITSVAVKNGIVAVASPNADEQQNGSVVFFNTNGDFQKQVTVGALPDMVTFTPDGTKVLTANEGQPNMPYTVDPEGSVSVIDISGGIASLTQANVTTMLFTAFNAQESTLVSQGVRKLFAASTLSQDLEPEYITLSADSKKGWVTLQENNAVAEFNLNSKTITAIWPLGKKDFNIAGSGLDASDNSGIVHLSNYPVKSFFIPDAIASFTAGGKTYLVTANEGDEKEYDGFEERTTVGSSSTVLDPTVFPNAEVLKEDFNIGRLRITNLNGDTDNDGDYDELLMTGARSFSIWDAETKTLVYDSQDDFELITSKDPAISALFNADNENNTFKSRSRAKGPEPEGVTVATINGQVYAFIGLERVGGVMLYNITDPANVKFVDYKNSRDLTALGGDLGPEGIIYISPEQSPDGKGYCAVANELSGTVSIYEIDGDGTLPVQLVSYTAQLQPGNEVLLNWSTSSEQNNDYFRIERSTDGKLFSKLSDISSKGDAAYMQYYSYRDMEPAAGKNYYKLSQTDKDGIRKMEQIRLVTVGEETGKGFSVSPNPVSAGNIIVVKLKGYNLQHISAGLYNAEGKLLYNTRAGVANNKANITLPFKPAAGVYLLHINGVGTTRIIINR